LTSIPIQLEANRQRVRETVNESDREDLVRDTVSWLLEQGENLNTRSFRNLTQRPTQEPMQVVVHTNGTIRTAIVTLSDDQWPSFQRRLSNASFYEVDDLESFLRAITQ